MAARAVRRANPSVDVSAFVDQVQAALSAFGQDVTYAVAMARAAVVIANKRAMWAARADLRVAESRAHTLCANTDPFACYAVSACGTGDCKFAAGEYAQLSTVASTGKHIRPQASNAGDYCLDEAVTALVELRKAR